MYILNNYRFGFNLTRIVVQSIGYINPIRVYSSNVKKFSTKKKRKEETFQRRNSVKSGERRLLARWNEQTIRDSRGDKRCEKRGRVKEGGGCRKEKRVQLFNAYLPQAACLPSVKLK